MTQKLINKYFLSPLGEQCNSLFTTSDNQVFIRYEEAREHEATLTNEYSSIKEWFNTNEL